MNGTSRPLRTSRASASRPLHPGMDSPQQSLLVVEDDEATAAFLADNLAADGYKLAIAGGAGEGLRAIEVRGSFFRIPRALMQPPVRRHHSITGERRTAQA